MDIRSPKNRQRHKNVPSIPFSSFQKFLIVLGFVTVGVGGYFVLVTFGGTTANLTLGTQDATEDGLVGHWTLDGENMDHSQSGAEVRDRSGSGFHGALSGFTGNPESATTTVPGRIGQALRFGTGVGVATIVRESATHTTDGTLTFSMPATRPDDDLYLLFAHSESNSAMTAPAGWTTIAASDDINGNTAYYLAAWRIGDSEPATYDLGGTMDEGVVSVMRFSGIDTAAPINQSGFARDDDDTADAPAVTPTVDDTLVIRMYSTDGLDFTSIPATEWFNETGLNNSDQAASYEDGPASGVSSGVATANLSGSDEWGAVTVAIAPGSVPSGSVSVGTANTSVKTVAFWMNADSTTEEIIELNGSADIAVSGGTLAATGFTSPTIYVDGAVSSTITANTWHHVIVVTDTGINASALNIGSVGGTVYAGILDDVRTYNRALSADDISRLYKLGATTKLNTTVHTQPTLESGLAAHWTFDGADMSPNVRDRSVNGNHGTLVSMSTTTAPGRIGQALSFDGSAGILDVPQHASINLDDRMTVAFWMKMPNGQPDSFSQVIDKIGSGEGWKIQVESAGPDIEFRLDTSVSTNQKPADITDVFDDSWHHVVWTIDSGTIDAYKDGVQVVSAASYSHGNGFGNTAALGIGDGGGGTSPINGLLDDVRIYNRALSADEITRLYKLGATTKINPTVNSQPALASGLLGHWTFDGKDFSETLVPSDLSGNDNEGFLHDGLVGYWRLDETAADGCAGGEDSCDFSGYGNHGVWSGASGSNTAFPPDTNTATTTYANPRSLDFDATDDSVVINHDGVLDELDELTVMAWIYPKSDGEGSCGRIVDKSPVNNDFLFWMSGTRRLAFQARRWDGTEGTWISSNFGMNHNMWQHVAVTYDHSNIANDATLYRNGVKIVPGTDTNPTGSVASEPGEIYIGASDSGGCAFDGQIDDVRIYNRVLTSAEVALIAQGGYGNNSLAAPGRIGQAISLGGVNDFIHFGDVDGGGANVRTIAFWMKAATTTVNQQLITIDDTDPDFIDTDGAGALTANSITGATVYVDGSSVSATIPDTGWHHVVVTTSTGLNADDFSAGRTADGFFGGSLDDVRLYNRVLSDEEIQKLYQLGE